MQDALLKELDFDAWLNLAHTSPQDFESRRREVIEEFISSAPARHQHRLRQLQWRIDMERKRASNPLAACIRINRMMWESLSGDHGLLGALRQLTGEPCRKSERKCAGKILTMTPRHVES